MRLRKPRPRISACLSHVLMGFVIVLWWQWLVMDMVTSKVSKVKMPYGKTWLAILSEGSITLNPMAWTR